VCGVGADVPTRATSDVACAACWWREDFATKAMPLLATDARVRVKRWQYPTGTPPYPVRWAAVLRRDDTVVYHGHEAAMVAVVQQPAAAAIAIALVAVAAMYCAVNTLRLLCRGRGASSSSSSSSSSRSSRSRTVRAATPSR
jgi:hypothetical protein